MRTVAPTVAPLAVDAVCDWPAATAADTPSGPAARKPIDATKIRTRKCHYFASGQPCRFGDRCAFVHGDDPIERPLPRSKQLQLQREAGEKLSSNGLSEVPSPAYSLPTTPMKNNAVERDQCSLNPSSGSSANGDMCAMPPPPPPPAYDEAVVPATTPAYSSSNSAYFYYASNGLSGSPSYCNSNDDDSRPVSPPCYPTRFRYDPYTPRGLVFAF